MYHQIPSPRGERLSTQAKRLNEITCLREPWCSQPGRNGSGMAPSLVRSVMAGFACVLLLLIGGWETTSASAEEVSSAVGGESSSSLGGSMSLANDRLVIGSMLTEGELLRDQEEARLASPEFVRLRTESEAAYESLSVQEGEEVDGGALPSLAYEPGGGLRKMPEGERVSSFSSAFSAVVELPDGKHGVLESASPIAVQDSSGQFVPVDVAPRQVGSSFEAVTPPAGMRVRVGSRLGEGASFADSGMTMAPVTEDGAPLEASGVIDGAGVFYGDSEDAQAGVLDMDSFIKIGAGSFSEDTILRSRRSPHTLYFRVGLPQGASLAQANGGAVRVVDQGEVIASVSTPGAQDSAGVSVPVSMSVSAGNVLTLTVDDLSTPHTYPIDVDPTIVEKDGYEQYKGGRWVFEDESNGAFTELSIGAGGENDTPAIVHTEHDPEYREGQNAYLEYTTKGESKIYSFRLNTSREAEDTLTVPFIAIAGSALEAGPLQIPPTLCCGTWFEVTAGGSNGNTAVFGTLAARSGNRNFQHELRNVEVGISQEKGPSISFNTTEKTLLNGVENALYEHQWVNSGKAGVTAETSDPGLGVESATAKSPNSSYWTTGYTDRSECAGIQCPSHENFMYSLAFGELPEGEDSVEVKAKDPVGLEANTGLYKIKIDNKAPHNLVISGLGSGNVIGERGYVLKAEATDGSGSLLSSGVKSIAAFVDGLQLGKRTGGACSPGPCTAIAEWAINGSEFAVGEHKLRVVVTDNAGNEVSEEITMKVHHASPVPVGPGAVGAVSGQMILNSTDVTIGDAGPALTVNRAYYSRSLTAGSGGPLGPQWTISVGGYEDIVQLNTSARLDSANGGKTMFSSNGKGGFIAPKGDANLSLSEVKNEKGELVEYAFREAANAATIRFTRVGLSSLFKPTRQEGPIASRTVTYTYQTVEGVTEPVQALAPEPAGVSCTELKAGCRALTFKYATATAATGEKESEWNEYKGRLNQVVFHAYNPSSKTMEEKTVAQYSYDNQGRLRAEWDPRVSPALKTIYGYDSEGHVTAITSPGQESWAFTYGTITGDTNTGRLLKLTRAPASAKLWAGELAANTEAPKLSGTSVVGVKMGVSSGVWSNSPVAYSYQWEDCNSEGKACTPILGATNANYTVASSDVGHTLVAQVQAINGGGAVAAVTAASGLVTSTGTKTEGTSYQPGPGSAIEYHVPVSGTGLPTLTKEEVEKWGQKDDPTEGMAVFPPDEPQGWPSASYKRASIIYLDEEDHAVNMYGPAGGVSTTEYNELNDVVRTLTVDGRATALKEGCVSKTECRSAEVSELLDMESVYNTTGSEPGTQLLETLGPQHTVKLAQGKERTGEEVLAREHTKYFYDEGAPAEGAPYDLVTKTIDGAQTPSKEEFDKRETVTSYSGQQGLGWELRQPTSVTTDPKSLKLTHTTFYDPGTGNITETRTPAAGSGETAANSYAYKAQYSKETEAETCTTVLMKHPDGAAFDSAGNMWVLDTASDKVDELSPTGRTIIRFGSEGSGNVQFKEPGGLAIDKEGHIWISDTGNNRVQELSTKGEFIKSFGIEGKETGQFKKPTGIVFNSEGDIWVADHGNGRLQEFSSSGTYIRQALALGAPEGVTVDSKNNLWATVGSTVAEYAPTGVLPLMSFGEAGTENGKFKEPAGLAFSGANLYVVDRGNSRVQEFQITEVEGKASSKYVAKFGTSGGGQGEFKEPQGITFDKEGHVWIADSANNRIEELTTAGEYLAQASNVGETCMKNPGALALDPSGNVWVADTANDRVAELSSTGKALLRFGTEGSLTSQFKEPRGIATDSSGNVWVADTANNRVQEFGSKGEYLRTVGSAGKESGQLEKPTGVAISSEGPVWVADSGNERLEEFSSTGTYLAQITGYKPEGIAADAKGNIWFTTKTNVVWDYSPSAKKAVGWLGGSTEFKHAAGLAVSGENVYVADRGSNRVLVFKYAEKEGTLAHEYLTSFGKGGTGNGQFEEPAGVALDKEGNVWVTDAGNSRVQEFMQTSTGPHATQTIYYTAGSNLRYPACGEHAEWANLPCQTQPAEQPGTSGLPNLPVTTYTAYNMLDELEKKTETVGSTTRTTTSTYDPAGRLKTNAVSSSVGTALPTITEEYSSETGMPIRGCANEGKPCTEGKPATITSTYNTLGQLTAYTDASEATTTYEYEGEGIYKGAKELDGRLRHVNDSKGTETLTYNETTGWPSEVLNEYGTTKLTFTATYDTEGNMLTESYPNGMNAIRAYNALGTPVALEYKKTTHCTEKCAWFSDTVIPTIHDQWFEQTSTLSHQTYAYDAAGRLTQVQNTPTGKNCTTRIYAYDEDTNRTSLTTREPNSKGECATEGGTVEKHTYDSADRLTDTGTAYNTFGDITGLPAGDAGGKEPSEGLTSTYYTDNQPASQTQSGETISYKLDPAMRTLETIATGKTVANTTLHYAGPASAPAWTSNSTGETTRNIPGINGQLAAIQNNSETPELQLANLHGDIIAKAYLSETATSLASTADTSEFGVPTTNLPSKYSWLGALEIPTELPSGVTTTGVRSYVPEIGRYLQPDPIPGGSANAYTYTFGDPVNTSDPSGQSTIKELVAGYAAEVSHEYRVKEEAEIAARRAAEEAAARAAAETAAVEASWTRQWENYYAGANEGYSGEEEWYEEEWYEEEYEYASYKSGEEEAHTEPALLVQPLGEEASANGDEETTLAHRIFVGAAGHGNRPPGHGHHGRANEGSACGRRNGCGGGGDGKDGCYWVAGSLGGLVGGAIGTLVGPGGTMVGGAVGSYAATKVCG